LTEIAFLLYPDMTALDAIGPHEVPATARRRGALRGLDARQAHHRLHDTAAVDWLRRAHQTSPAEVSG
jgi:hypothetical protein